MRFSQDLLIETKNKAELFKKDSAKISNPKTKSDYFNYMCPTIEQKAQMAVALKDMYGDDESVEEWVSDELERCYQFAAMNLGIYIKHTIMDMMELFDRAFKLMLENMQYRRKSDNTEKVAPFARGKSEYSEGATGYKEKVYTKRREKPEKQRDFGVDQGGSEKSRINTERSATRYTKFSGGGSGINYGWGSDSGGGGSYTPVSFKESSGFGFQMGM